MIKLELATDTVVMIGKKPWKVVSIGSMEGQYLLSRVAGNSIQKQWHDERNFDLFWLQVGDEVVAGATSYKITDIICSVEGAYLELYTMGQGAHLDRNILYQDLIQPVSFLKAQHPEQ